MEVKHRVAVAALTMSAAAFVGLAQRESYTDKAIIPTKGDVPTIGFGTTEGVKLGDTITPPAALDRALKDVTKFEGAIKQCVAVPLAQAEYDAYVDLIYNVGPGQPGVKDGFCWARRGGPSTLVRKLNAGDYRGACRQILEWRFYKGQDCSQPNKVCGGLWARRKETYLKCMEAQ